MPLLKRPEPDAPAAVVLDLTDLGAQAARLRAQVRAEADAVLEAAQAEAATLGAAAEEGGREEGRVAGHAEGLEAGREQGRAEALAAEREKLQAAAAAWTQAAAGVEAARADLAQEAESAVLRLAVALAEKVVARHLETHGTGGAAVDAVRDSLSHVLDPVAATARVHHDDLAAVEEALPGFEPPGGGAVRVVASEDVDRGGCVVRHGAGEVDARVGVKLARLAELLLGGGPRADEQGEDPREADEPDAEGESDRTSP